MAPQGDYLVKVPTLLRAGYKVSEVANNVGLAQPLTRSRSCALDTAKQNEELQDRPPQ